MGSYWVPKMKWQLVDLLTQTYPQDRKKFKQMNKNQLYAILHRVRGGK